jgi:imidazole glycerol-phosphate synthase subunit HisH
VGVVVCDVGLGNLRSVERGLLEAGRGRHIDVQITSDPARVRAADRLVIPGQGGFGDCALALRGALGEAVRAHIDAARPYLGICLGLQVLFRSSQEAPSSEGLGIFEGSVVKLRGGTDPTTNMPLKIPHMGWNVAEPAENPGLLEGPAHYYFVHSYVVAPADRSIVAATTEYGERFVCAVAKDNIFACQFHPEKSQGAGLALLGRFLAA